MGMIVNLIKSDGTLIPCYMRLSVLLPKSVCHSVSGLEDVYLSDEEGGGGAVGGQSNNQNSSKWCQTMNPPTKSANENNELNSHYMTFNQPQHLQNKFTQIPPIMKKMSGKLTLMVT